MKLLIAFAVVAIVGANAQVWRSDQYVHELPQGQGHYLATGPAGSHISTVHSAVIDSQGFVRSFPSSVRLSQREGTYIARTPGAIHTARLPGSPDSVHSINDAPALRHY